MAPSHASLAADPPLPRTDRSVAGSVVRMVLLWSAAGGLAAMAIIGSSPEPPSLGHPSDVSFSSVLVAFAACVLIQGGGAVLEFVVPRRPMVPRTRDAVTALLAIIACIDVVVLLYWAALVHIGTMPEMR